MEQIIIFMILVGCGYFFGSRAEKKHYISIIEREKSFLSMKESCPDATQLINLRIETSSITKGAKKQIGSIEVLAYGTAIFFSSFILFWDYLWILPQTTSHLNLRRISSTTFPWSIFRQPNPMIHGWKNYSSSRISSVNAQTSRFPFRYISINLIPLMPWPCQGGHILLFQGLLDILKTENSLSFVIGHELGHFKNRDHLRGLGRGIVLTALSATFTGANSNLTSLLPRPLS